MSRKYSHARDTLTRFCASGERRTVTTQDIADETGLPFRVVGSFLNAHGDWQNDHQLPDGSLIVWWRIGEKTGYIPPDLGQDAGERRPSRPQRVIELTMLVLGTLSTFLEDKT